jgi:nitrite reductase (NADH) small subunit
MNDMQWIRLTRIDTLPLREGRAVMLAGRELAVFNLGDRVLVTDNRCPHQGGPLCDGIVTGSAVVCPLHAWKIDLDSGCVLRPSARPDAAIDTYPTRVVDGVVLVGLPGDDDVVPMTPPPSGSPISEGDFRPPVQRS